jgi:hypothetical protein
MIFLYFLYFHLSFPLSLDLDTLFIEIYVTFKIFYFDCLIVGLLFFLIAPLIARHDI